VTALPREARDGLMRAWLDLLSERHPGVTWIPVDARAAQNEQLTNEKEKIAT
jgi:hypothetical protein